MKSQKTTVSIYTCHNVSLIPLTIEDYNRSNFSGGSFGIQDLEILEIPWMSAGSNYVAIAKYQQPTKPYVTGNSKRNFLKQEYNY